MSLNRTILLVEDEAIIAMGEAAILKRAGFTVLTVLSGEEAVTVVKSDPTIDLVLMDVDLGSGMDGTRTAEIILAERDVPIIFLSNHTESEIVERTDRISSYGYVVKNAGDDVLFATIKMAFRLHEAHSRLKAREQKLAAALAEQARVQADLRREQENVLHIFSAVPIGLLIVNQDTVIQRANQTACDMVLREPADVIGQRAGDGLLCSHSFEDTRGCGYATACAECGLRNCILRVLNDGKSVDGEVVDVTLIVGGRSLSRSLKINAEPINLDGSPQVIVAIDDISSLKRTEDVLRASEERFQLLYQQAPLGYQSLDAEGRFLEVNQAWLDQLGYSREEVIGRWFGDFLAPEMADLFRQRFPRFKDVGEIHQLEFEMIRKDGTPITVAFDGKISYDPEGTFRQTHCIFNNITERKQVDKAIQQTLKEKEILLRDLQHRVKNSLAIIRGMIGLELSRTADLKLQQILQNIRNRIGALARLYELLFRSGDSRTIQLAQYLEEMSRSLYGSYADSQRIRLETSLEDVSLDVESAVPLGLILTELLTNSLKHAFTPESDGAIRIDLAREDSQGILDVIDDGIGLPQPDGKTEPEGLGFELVRMLCAQIGGRLEILPGSGTGFRLVFPLKESAGGDHP